MSVISPLGTTLDEFWTALSSGRSGIRALQYDAPNDLAISCGGQVADFTGHIDDFGDLDNDRKRAIRKGLKLMCREIQMGVAASQKALAHAGLAPGSYEPSEFGVTFGCDHIVTRPDDFTEGVRSCTEADRSFAYARWAKDGLPKVSPLWLLKYLPNMPASHIAILNQLCGPNNSLTYREAAGNLSIGEAFRTIQRGAASRMLAGATGCNIGPIKSLFVCLQSQLAQNNGDPADLCRPFDLGRTGMVAGEGAAALILEELETATARGATIHGEVLGDGSSIAVDRSGAACNDVAICNAMRSALRSADVKPEQIGHLHAHGLSTRQSDIDESLAIGKTFGAHANTLPVVAAKSSFGNLGAASGIVELIASVMAIQNGQLFPTLNYRDPDPDCPICVVDRPESISNPIVLNVSCTPQGQASAVVVAASNPSRKRCQIV
jgi:3-oxoacyl-[acyl-carrier-protein] synthase II